MKSFNFLALAALALVVSSPAFAGHGGKPHCGKGHHGKGGHHMFERADTNKDGAISKTEFRAQGDKMFAKLDMNKDGRITKAESQEAKAKWMAKHKAKRDMKRYEKRVEKGGEVRHVEDSKIFYNR